MSSVSIILPFYNHWEMTHQRLAEIYRHVSEPVEIVLVNDCSTEPDCKSGIAWWQKSIQRHTIKYVWNKENLGFGGSHNRGFKASSGDIVIFLSNDVMINCDFVQTINGIIKENRDVIIGGRIVYWDSGWNTLILKGRETIIPYPEGWLIATTRELWDRIGGFDMAYGKFDAEDIDIGAWAIYNNIKIIPLNLPGLKHLSGRTIYEMYPNRMDYTKVNIEILKTKWTSLLEEKLYD
jgi:GT2 family glycosyltransferase